MVETRFQTSFIPKAPVTEEAKRPVGVSILFLISFLIFVVAIAGSIGVFIWNKTLISQIAKGKQILEDHKNAFDATSIKEFTRLDSRIDVANDLLKNHISVAEIFPRLQDNTLRTVRFNNFAYTNAGNGKIMINMGGEALDYESMALQAQRFTIPELQNSFRSPIFSNFSKQKDTVVFTFASGIDPDVVSYYQSHLNAMKQAQNAPQTPTLPVNQSGQ